MIKVLNGETPVEYYGGQLDNISDLKYLVGVDWCELSCKGDLSYTFGNESYKSGDYEFVENDIRSRFFNVSFNIYEKGELLGYLLASPRSEIIPVETVQIKVDNQQFYKRRLDLNTRLKKLLNHFELDFHNFTRLDVFIDFHRFNPGLSFREFVDAYSNRSIGCKGKVSGWDLYHSKVKSELDSEIMVMAITGFSFGSRSSDKFIRCYNKSIELEKSHKPYIENWWKANGFENKEVYRFELQMNSKFLRKTKGFVNRKKLFIEKKWTEIIDKFFDISNSKSLVELLRYGTKNYFEFFEEDESVKRNDDKVPFEIFDWGRISNLVNSGYKYIREKLTHVKTTWRQKMIVARNLFREYMVNFQDDGWLSYCAKIIYDYQLQKRWDRMWLKYVFEFGPTLAVRYNFNVNDYEKSWAGYMVKYASDSLGVKKAPPLQLSMFDGRKVLSLNVIDKKNGKR